MSAPISDKLTITLSGATGSGTVKDGPLMRGILNAVALKYTGVPGTSVVTITDTVGGVTRTLLVVTGNTDGMFYPQQPTHQNSDGAVIADQWTPTVLVGSQISVAVTVSGAGSIDVSLVVLD